MTELSPDAQAVWDAAWNNCPVQCGDIEGTRRSQVAAALRAAVQRTTFQDAWNDKFLSAEKMLSIANELDGTATPQRSTLMETPDMRRLCYIMQNGPDGFCNVKKDRYEFAIELAEQAGREEPNEMDELNGFRLLIDAAIAADIEERQQVAARSFPSEKT